MTATAIEASNVHTRAYVAYGLTLLALTGAVCSMDISVLSVLLPSIKTDFRVTDAQLGALGGVALAANAACGVPIARFADTWIRKRILALALTAWSIMTMLCGMAGSFALLVAARAGVGASESGAGSPCYSLIADIVPPEKRAGAFSWLFVGGMIGGAIGLAAGGYLGAKIGWRFTLILFGLPGIALAAVIMFTFREPVRGSFDRVQVSAEKTSSLSAIYGLFSRPSFVHLLIAFTVAGMSGSLGVWLPTYLMREFSVSSTAIGLAFGPAVGASSILSAVLGGFLGNRLMARDLRWAAWLAAVAIASSVPILAMALFARSFVMVIAIYAVFSLVANLGNAASTAMITLVAKQRERALAGAIVILVGGIIGYGGGTWMVGYLSDLFKSTGHVHALRDAFLCTLVFPIWACAHLLLAARSLRADALAASGVEVQ